jgi:hypothetical protein
VRQSRGGRSRRSEAMPGDLSDEETFEPLQADDPNYYKVEKWTGTVSKSTTCSMPATISGEHKKSSPRL